MTITYNWVYNITKIHTEGNEIQWLIQKDGFFSWSGKLYFVFDLNVPQIFNEKPKKGEEPVDENDYIIWDYSAPGISFNVDTGRITIFKTTLVAMGYPEYFHFLFSPEDLAFGIEPCNIDDGGANRLPDNLSRDHYDIKSKDLVRFVFRSCGWKKKLTYRVPGVKPSPDSHKVYFDLRQALEVHEGRTKPAK